MLFAALQDFIIQNHSEPVFLQDSFLESCNNMLDYSVNKIN